MKKMNWVKVLVVGFFGCLQIIGAAELKAQLVVMGTVGRRGVRAQVLGNTAEEALQLLKTDTLTLKP